MDDTLFMAQRWWAAGNEGALKIYPGGVHGFDAFEDDLAIARQANDDILDFIARRA